MTDPRSAEKASPELLALIEAIPADFADPAADYRQVRKTMAPFHSQPCSDDLQIAEVRSADCAYARYRIERGGSRFLAVHMHGGAFVSIPVADYHFYAELIARQLGCEVVMPDYRLAPEHPYPAAHEDCLAVYRSLLEDGEDPGRIIVFGESCGGGLAVAMLVRARDAGLPMPRGFVSLTGWFDLSVEGPTVTGRDPFLTPEWVRNRGRDYLAGQCELDDPDVSPAYADLQGLPQMYLQIPEFDTVREGAIRLGCNAMRVGVPVCMELLPRSIHGVHGLINAGVPEAHEAWQRISKWCDETLRLAGD